MPQTPERKREYARERYEQHGPRLRAKAAEWRDQNRNHLREKNHLRRRTKRAMCLVAAARIRARRKNTPFDLGPNDIAALQKIIDEGHCEISGVELRFRGPRSAVSPSLDRIEPQLGYVPGNVRIVCHALNAGMGDWGEAELLRVVEAWMSSPKSRRRS